MATRGDFVAAARSWAGTPFRWEASVKGIGCDCKGLLAGVARELGLPQADTIEAAWRGYSRKVDVWALRKGMGRLFDPSPSPEPSDVLLLVVGGLAQHLAIVTEPGRMIHTMGRGPACVIEVPIGKSRLIDSVWKWRGLDG